MKLQHLRNRHFKYQKNGQIKQLKQVEIKHLKHFNLPGTYEKTVTKANYQNGHELNSFTKTTTKNRYKKYVIAGLLVTAGIVALTCDPHFEITIERKHNHA